MAVKLRRRKDGLSALFDAILFFIIILAATGALFYWASALTASTTEDLATRGLGRSAADIQSSALECDIGPVNYSAEGRELAFTGSVHECIRTILLCRSADQNSDFSGLVEAVRGIYALLVERPFHFQLRASVGGLGPDLLISERAGESETPGAGRWTCATPLIVNGMEGELTLYIWR